MDNINQTANETINCQYISFTLPCVDSILHSFYSMSRLRSIGSYCLPTHRRNTQRKYYDDPSRTSLT